jgi:hypothetical protein
VGRVDHVSQVSFAVPYCNLQALFESGRAWPYAAPFNDICLGRIIKGGLGGQGVCVCVCVCVCVWTGLRVKWDGTNNPYTPEHALEHDNPLA